MATVSMILGLVFLVAFVWTLLAALCAPAIGRWLARSAEANTRPIDEDSGR